MAVIVETVETLDHTGNNYCVLHKHLWPGLADARLQME